MFLGILSCVADRRHKAYIQEDPLFFLHDTYPPCFFEGHLWCDDNYATGTAFAILAMFLQDTYPPCFFCRTPILLVSTWAPPPTWSASWSTRCVKPNEPKVEKLSEAKVEKPNEAKVEKPNEAKVVKLSEAKVVKLSEKLKSHLTAQHPLWRAGRHLHVWRWSQRLHLPHREGADRHLFTFLKSTLLFPCHEIFHASPFISVNLSLWDLWQLCWGTSLPEARSLTFSEGRKSRWWRRTWPSCWGACLCPGWRVAWSTWSTHRLEKGPRFCRWNS